MKKFLALAAATVIAIPVATMDGAFAKPTPPTQAQIDAARVKRSVEGLQGLRLLEQDRVNQIERINQALEKQKKLDTVILTQYIDRSRYLLSPGDESPPIGKK